MIDRTHENRFVWPCSIERISHVDFPENGVVMGFSMAVMMRYNEWFSAPVRYVARKNPLTC